MEAVTDYDKHIDYIIELAEKIKPGEVTVLTGGNGKGKSLIRKVLHQFLGEDTKIISKSLDDRTGLHTHGFDMFNRDVDWMPCSTQSYNHFKNINDAKDVFVILDEPEVGMSEEFQAAVAVKLNSIKEEFLKNNKGLLIITHSRQLVKHIDCDNFINIEGMTKNEWVNRDVTPLDIDELEKWSLELMRAVENRLK